MNRFGIFDVAFYDTDANKIIHRKSFCVGWVGDSGGFGEVESPDASGADNVDCIYNVAELYALQYMRLQIATHGRDG